jgi:membrane peptidoglycan carboxypeptidase
MRSRLTPAGEIAVAVAVLVLCLGLVVDGLAVVAGLWAKSRSDAFVALPASIQTSYVPERSVMLDARGRPIAYFWDQNRQSVPTSGMSPLVRDAAVAVEDARFWSNKGVDLQGMVRALVHNVTAGEHQGGSTITQQYVKNLLVLKARSKEEQQAATALTSSRKLAEARYAVAITQRMSKDEILTGYLNAAYFGRNAYGIQSAAETFFATDARHLTLPQAALLAGLVRGPANYDPVAHPKAALARRNVVLDRMLETGKISQAQAVQAKASPLGIRDGARHAGCPSSPVGYFCDWVQRQLLDDPALGKTRAQRQQRLDTAGLVVRTTLDPRVQASTQRAVDRARGSRAAAASVVVQPGTGAVQAMAASVPFGFTHGRSSVNLPLGGSTGFQAGSTFKVFVLTEAIKRGIPLDLRMYAPQKYTSRKFAPYNIVDGHTEPYTVGNAADSESGVFTLQQATWHSVNTYFIKLEERVGFTAPARIAESMGVRRADGGRLHRIPSFTLGTNEVSPLAMAGAMATYAAHGRYCPPYAIAGVQGAKVKARSTCRQVLDRHVADTVTRVLEGVVEKGTGTNAKVPGDAAGKTGTVQDFSAAWFVGYTPRYAAVVWMGDPRGGYGHPLTNVRVNGRFYKHMYGGDLPAAIWGALVAGSPGGGSAFHLSSPAPTKRVSGDTRRTSSPAPGPAPAPKPHSTCLERHGKKCR